MKKILYFTAFALLCFAASPLMAEEAIKVLILEGPNSPVLSKDAEKLGTMNGDILINDHIYSGLIDIRRDRNGLHFINELLFEKYIEGVVAVETGADWAVEALKAQAVVSRTYALYQKNLNAGNDFHLTSSTLHQVYKGGNSNSSISGAVKETGGEILTYQDKPIEAFYHSTCKGETALPEEVWGKSYPFFKSVPCVEKNSPYENWQRRFSIAEIERALGITGIKDISIASMTASNRVKTIKVVAMNSETEVKATDLRKLLGFKELPSTRFSVVTEEGYVIFEGGGYGHGVGLSQWGALELANEGKNYKEILEYYYPGTELKKM